MLVCLYVYVVTLESSVLFVESASLCVLRCRYIGMCVYVLYVCVCVCVCVFLPVRLCAQSHARVPLARGIDAPQAVENI